LVTFSHEWFTCVVNGKFVLAILHGPVVAPPKGGLILEAATFTSD
jgi:hypothetical protein